MTIRRAIAATLSVWIVGAFFLPLHGMIHALLVLALILFLVDRVGREGGRALDDRRAT